MSVCATNVIDIKALCEGPQSRREHLQRVRFPGRTLVVGVGYEYVRDMSLGPVVMERLQKDPWSPGVDLEELSYGPIGVMHHLDDHPAYDRVVFVAAVDRQRQPGFVYCYQWQRVPPDAAEIQARVAEDRHARSPRESHASMAVTTLVVGFGNLLLGDDGFGVEVIRRLATSVLPAHVDVLDVGIGGMHFVLRLMEGFKNVVVVDAMKGGQPPGTVYVFRLDEADLRECSAERFDPHLTEPLQAMQLGKRLGCLPDTVTMVGCEPETCEPGMGLTVAVRAAVDRAVETIQEMVGSHGNQS